MIKIILLALLLTGQELMACSPISGLIAPTQTSVSTLIETIDYGDSIAKIYYDTLKVRDPAILNPVSSDYIATKVYKLRRLYTLNDLRIELDYLKNKAHLSIFEFEKENNSPSDFYFESCDRVQYEYDQFFAGADTTWVGVNTDIQGLDSLWIPHMYRVCEQSEFFDLTSEYITWSLFKPKSLTTVLGETVNPSQTPNIPVWNPDNSASCNFEYFDDSKPFIISWDDWDDVANALIFDVSIKSLSKYSNNKLSLNADKTQLNYPGQMSIALAELPNLLSRDILTDVHNHVDTLEMALVSNKYLAHTMSNLKIINNQLILPYDANWQFIDISGKINREFKGDKIEWEPSFKNLYLRELK